MISEGWFIGDLLQLEEVVSRVAAYRVKLTTRCASAGVCKGRAEAKRGKEIQSNSVI